MCTLQSSCGILLIVKLHKGKIATYANMKDIAVRFKVSFYISGSSTSRVKVYDKQCFGWSLVSTRLRAITVSTTFTLSITVAIVKKMPIINKSYFLSEEEMSNGLYFSNFGKDEDRNITFAHSTDRQRLSYPNGMLSVPRMASAASLSSSK